VRGKSNPSYRFVLLGVLAGALLAPVGAAHAQLESMGFEFSDRENVF